ncbi:MAG TPA: hypothetical protein VEB42_01130 [Chitinophagaceae bacterium]|nr:hypothetical protein [Chitinophagaceae bacterium]
MEENLEQVDPKYQEGFNKGYLIAEHHPTLAAQLAAKPNDHSEFFKGLVAGKEQHEKEARDKEGLEWAKSKTKGLPAKDDRDQHKER